jgi:hypothetical protein
MSPHVQVLPCSLSATTYHLFQLTECSTVFLHLSWMASKSQARYDWLFKVSIALLGTFAVRCLITVGIVWHVITRLLELKLWSVRPPVLPTTQRLLMLRTECHYFLAHSITSLVLFLCTPVWYLLR